VINKWVKEGRDLKVMGPYLAKHLGHKTMNETYYYYGLVPEAYEAIQTAKKKMGLVGKWTAFERFVWYNKFRR